MQEGAHYMTYIAQTRLTNNNWRQKLGHL